MNDKINSMERPKTDWEAASRINEDPKEFNYRLWNGKPICSSISLKLDPTRALVDRNKHGQYESNHLLELTFFDGTKESVDIDVWGANFERSPKMVAAILTNPRNPKDVLGYEFTDTKF